MYFQIVPVIISASIDCIISCFYLQSISAYSGHYRPTDERLDSFLSILAQNGVNLNEVEVIVLKLESIHFYMIILLCDRKMHVDSRFTEHQMTRIHTKTILQLQQNFQPKRRRRRKTWLLLTSQKLLTPSQRALIIGHSPEGYRALEQISQRSLFFIESTPRRQPGLTN